MCLSCTVSYRQLMCMLSRRRHDDNLIGVRTALVAARFKRYNRLTTDGGLQLTARNVHCVYGCWFAAS